MVRRLWIYGLFAVAGSAVLVAAAVEGASLLGGAGGKYILGFAAVAALIGWLNLIVAFLTYRLEAGRVPSPAVSFLTADGETDQLTIGLLTEEPVDVTEEIERVGDRLRADARQGRQGRQSSNLLPLALISPTDEDWKEFDRDVELYLDNLASYHKEAAAYRAASSHVARVILAVSNRRAGVPAEGVRVILRFPDREAGILVEVDDPLGKSPTRPSPPIGTESSQHRRDHVPSLQHSLDHVALSDGLAEHPAAGQRLQPIGH